MSRKMVGDESLRLGLASLGFMCAASAALVGRAAGDTLFLDRFDAGTLAYMYIGTAAIVGTFSFVLGWTSAKLGISRLAVRTALALIALSVGVWALRAVESRALGVVAFYVGDLLVFVPVLIFWSFATQLFHPREAKRLFGYVGAAGTTACIATGFLVPVVSRSLGTSSLFLVAAALMGLFAVAGRALRRFEHEGGSARTTSVAHKPPSPSRIWTSRQTRDLAMMVFLATVALTLVDFQFKTGAKALFVGADLASFFGSFYGVGNAVALVIQLFLVHRIMRHGGLLLGLRILPAAMVLTSIATALLREFEAAVAAKFMVQIFAFTVDVTALQVLYMGVSRSSRSQTRALVDGMLKPAAIAVAGAAALAVSGAAVAAAETFGSFPVLSGAAALASLGWFVWTGRNHENYVAALSDSLKRGRLDLTDETVMLEDRAAFEVLRRTVREAPDDTLVPLTQLVRTLPELDLTAEYVEALGRPSEDARLCALEYLAERADAATAGQVVPLLNDPLPQIRRAATEVVGRRATDARERLNERLEDSEATVRASAAVHLLVRGEAEDHDRAHQTLDALLTSASTGEREALASVLDGLDPVTALPRQAALLTDPEPEVRRTTLRTLRRRPAEELAELVVAELYDPSCAGEAEEAVLATGAAAVPLLSMRLAGELAHGRESDVRSRILHLLPKLQGGRAVLFDVLATARDAGLTRALLESLGRVRKASLSEPERRVVLDTLQEAVSAARDQQKLAGILAENTLLHHAAGQALGLLSEIICRSVALVAGVPADILLDGLVSSDRQRRAVVLEVIDNALDRKRRAEVMSVLDPGSHGESADITVLHDHESIAATSGWHAAGLIELFRTGGERLRSPWIHKQIDHPEPVVREAALWAIRELDPEGTAYAASRLVDDPHPAVRRLAARFAREPGPVGPSAGRPASV